MYWLENDGNSNKDNRIERDVGCLVRSVKTHIHTPTGDIDGAVSPIPQITPGFMYICPIREGEVREGHVLGGLGARPGSVGVHAERAEEIATPLGRYAALDVTVVRALARPRLRPLERVAGAAAPE